MHDLYDEVVGSQHSAVNNTRSLPQLPLEAPQYSSMICLRNAVGGSSQLKSCAVCVYVLQFVLAPPFSRWLYSSYRSVPWPRIFVLSHLRSYLKATVRPVRPAVLPVTVRTRTNCQSTEIFTSSTVEKLKQLLELLRCA